MATNKVPDSAYAKQQNENSFFKPMAKQETTSITIPNINAKVMEAIKEELSGLPFTFDRIRIPTGGGVVFELPNPEDPEKPIVAHSITGIIIDHYPAKVYWNTQGTATNAAPSCISIDGEIGIGNPGGRCKNCPNNQWGSKNNGRGRACKQIHRVYILVPNNSLPFEFNIPPTSIKNIADYLKRIALRGLRSYEVVTSISLKKATNKDGIVYSQAVFSLVEELPEQLKKQMAEVAAGIRKLTRRVVVSEPDEEEIENSTIEEAEKENIILDNFEESPKLGTTNNDNDLPF